MLYGVGKDSNLDNTASLLGLDGDYIQPSNRHGLVDPIVLDNRGHQSDDNGNGGKSPWHITSSDESRLSPDSGQWNIKNIEGQYEYTPSVMQINQYDKLGEEPYLNRLKEYFPVAEGSEGHSVQMPAPVRQDLYDISSHNWGN